MYGQRPHIPRPCRPPSPVRHMASQVILAQLNKAYPYPTDEVESSVHQMLGPINKDLIERCMAALQVCPAAWSVSGTRRGARAMHRR